jgi:hypothetical protein
MSVTTDVTAQAKNWQRSGVGGTGQWTKSSGMRNFFVVLVEHGPISVENI